MAGETKLRNQNRSFRKTSAEARRLSIARKRGKGDGRKTLCQFRRNLEQPALIHIGIACGGWTGKKTIPIRSRRRWPSGLVRYQWSHSRGCHHISCGVSPLPDHRHPAWTSTVWKTVLAVFIPTGCMQRTSRNGRNTNGCGTRIALVQISSQESEH